MRIAIDISQIVYEGTGVATYTRSLVRELLRLNANQRHDYVLFGASLRRKAILDQFADSLRRDGAKFEISFWLLPQTFTTEIWNEIHYVNIERLIGKVDVFHSSDWIQPPSKAHKVTTIHDLVVYKYPESSNQRLTISFRNLAPLPDIVSTQKKRLDWVKRECDLIIVDSKSTLKDCQQILAIPAQKMRVIYLGAGQEYQSFKSEDPKFKSRKIADIRQKYRLDKNYILAVGTREPRKNLDCLIRAFQNLTSDSVDLVIAGKYGWGDHQNASIPKNVKILGFVPQENLPALFAGAAVFAYPSLYEGFGIPILEAMTVGTPVLTSKLGSMPEAAGGAGIFVDPSDEKDIQNKLRQVLNLTPKEKAALVRKGDTQAKKFSWEKTAKETLKVYEELAK